MMTRTYAHPEHLRIPEGSPLRKADAWNETSQFGEDGLIHAAIRHYLLGLIPADAFCFECGASDGAFFSNTRRLRDEGWSAVLVEKDPAAAQLCRERYENDRVRVYEGELGKDHDADALIGGENCHVCSLDIDGGELELWAAMESRPCLMLGEHSPYDGADNRTGEGGYKQAGINPLVSLAEAKGYRHLATTFCNALFVAQELT
jgi:hypothetical protein